MKELERFPPDLLQQPVHVRLSYFKNKIISHPKLEEARDRLVRTIRDPAGAALVFVYGPTGVGKTTLCNRVIQLLIEESLAAMQLDPGHLPVAQMEVPAPSKLGNFSWPDYFIRGLEALWEPHIDKKVDYSSYGIRRSSDGRLIVDRRGPSEAALRRAFEATLRERRLLAFFNDEAQHFRKIRNPEKFLDQMDCVKSTASLGKTLHVLVGTYDLLGLVNLSAQLSRRATEIHLPRYSTDFQGDIDAFGSVLLSFQLHLPLEQEPDLTSDFQYFYMYSAGCVGVLKDWLHSALRETLLGDPKKSFREHVEETAKSLTQLANMVGELRAGEVQLVETEAKRATVRLHLGLDKQPGQASPPQQPGENEGGVEKGVEESSSFQQEGVEATGKKGKKGKKGSVGERNPIRDPVGVQADG